MKKPRAKPVYAYAIYDRGGLDLSSISDSRSELVRQANKPAGQSVVAVRISHVDKHPDTRPQQHRRGGE